MRAYTGLGITYLLHIDIAGGQRVVHRFGWSSGDGHAARRAISRHIAALQAAYEPGTLIRVARTWWGVSQAGEQSMQRVQRMQRMQASGNATRLCLICRKARKLASQDGRLEELLRFSVMQAKRKRARQQGS